LTLGSKDIPDTGRWEWAQRNEVQLHFSHPGQPTDNAFIESFNGHFRDECLNANWFMGIKGARAVIAEWLEDYNERRPHSALTISRRTSTSESKFRHHWWIEDGGQIHVGSDDPRVYFRDSAAAVAKIPRSISERSLAARAVVWNRGTIG
jgi:hypothetical protein